MKKRISLDVRGNPLIEVKSRDGVFERRGADDDVLRKLATGLSLEDSGRRRHAEPHGASGGVGQRPYRGASVEGSKQLRKRSGLDYMRALSEEIKRQRALKGDKG